jgi:hypothetical protein
MASRNSAQIQPNAIAAMADPPLRLMDGAAMDFFLIEMVNTLRTSSAVATARAQTVEQEMIDAGLLPPPPPPSSLKHQNRDSVGSLSLRSTKEDEEEPLRMRLESIGMHVGANIAER